MVQSEEYIYAFGGGVIIALATAFNLLMKGRITGISGILFGTISLNGFLWRSSFLLGMFLMYSYFYTFIRKEFFETPEVFTNGLSFAGFFVCGFLVGLGTKLANGCTSGHGVCGMPRLSIRSITASFTFCSFGIGIATLRNYYPFLVEQEFLDVVKTVSVPEFHYTFFAFLNFLAILIPIILFIKKNKDTLYDYLISLATGILMGIGLILSGMIKRNKVINFLNAGSSDWDASLLIVLISAVSVNLVLFYLIIKKKVTPVLAEKCELPTKTQLDIPLILGSAIFGVGWGIGGLCPGPLLVNIIMYIPHTLAFFSTLVIGQICGFLADKYIFSPKPKVDQKV